jgi:hypothetical protein
MRSLLESATLGSFEVALSRHRLGACTKPLGENDHKWPSEASGWYLAEIVLQQAALDVAADAGVKLAVLLASKHVKPMH